MSLEAVDDTMAAARQHFEEGLIRAGFVEQGSAWVGTIVHSQGATEVAVQLPSTFPFAAAKVWPIEADALPWSWHRDTDGALCLVAGDDHEDLWWADADAFLEHARAWIESANTGWSNDRPDLDLDRYFEPSTTDKRLFLFGDLAPFVGRPVRFEPIKNDVMKLVGLGTKPANSKGRLKRLFGVVVDLGEVAVPPRSWADIAANADSSLRLEAGIRAWAVDVVVILYRRGPQQGVLLLEVGPNTAGGISAFRLMAGADTDQAKAARSGPKAPRVKGKTVAVVGGGALGSFIADGLARCGVDSIAILDGDRLMPGNLVRHLVGNDGIGLYKSTAIKKDLESRFPGQVSVHAIEANLRTAHEAVALLEEADLVINATADFATTALLHVAAHSIEKHFLSVALQNDGDTLRIDVLPPMDGQESLPESRNPTLSSAPSYFDSGCGDPISPTAPSAVVETAGAAVRHAIGMLLSQPISSVGEVRDLTLDTGGPGRPS